MAKSKTVRMGEYEYTEAELDAMHKLAVERGKETLRTEPRAARAYYDAGSDRLVIDLTNGATFMVPRRLVQGLSDAPPELVAEVEIMDKFGLSLHWQKLDADFSVGGLVRGVFGTRLWMAELGRKGGRSTSAAKRAASRANGARGGRPPKAGRSGRAA
jgi:Protein of unknown function (DUF2442)